ncbi:hypothetical protein Ccrd_022608, partial [Cynara cardunculus var. scolymus]
MKLNESDLLVNDQNKYRSMWIRTYSSVWMLLGFILVVYLGHLYLWGMIIIIQISMASELHFFFTAMLYVYGRILSQQIMHAVTPEKFFYKLATSFMNQYAWTHMILIVVFTQSSFTAANIFEGIF